MVGGQVANTDSLMPEWKEAAPVGGLLDSAEDQYRGFRVPTAPVYGFTFPVAL
jgi:hypothetical protein